jgi:hypothetical protein
MPAPGILTGSTNRSNLFRRTNDSSQGLIRTGVFATHPGATPKYAVNRGPRDAEYQQTMARLFVEIPEGQMESFIDSLPEETRPLARVLASGGPTDGAGNTGFFDFLLTGAQESFAEKAQIVDTLTDNYVAFYSGQAPPVFTYRGVALNTYQDDQRVWLMRLYRDILRGTRLANRGLVAKLRYDSFLLTGYLENLTFDLRSETETSANFSFQFRVKRMSIFTRALGLPSTVVTPASQDRVVGQTQEEEDGTERIANFTPETPPTALDRPSADSSTLSDAEEESIRAELRAAGLSDADINAAFAEAQAAAAGTGAAADPRLALQTARSEGAERMEESVRGTAGTRNLAQETFENVQNVTNDAILGLTNVLNVHPAVVDIAVVSGALGSPISNVSLLRRRQMQRRRGGTQTPP